VDVAIIWGYTGGVKAPPGIYEVRMQVGDESMTQTVEVKEDPRIAEDISDEEYEAQLALGLQLRDAITEVHDYIGQIQSVKKQIEWLTEQSDNEEINELGPRLLKELTSYEEQLMQTKNQSGQDPIRFAPRLDNQLVENYGYVTGTDGYISGGREGKPSEAAYQRWDDLETTWTELRAEIKQQLEESAETFNELVKKYELLGVRLKKAKS
jgi:hypothetical protein